MQSLMEPIGWSLLCLLLIEFAGGEFPHLPKESLRTMVGSCLSETICTFTFLRRHWLTWINFNPGMDK